jgi:hypothetical protein
MQASLSHPTPFAHANGSDSDNDNVGFVETSYDERLRGLTREELADRLRWLSWYAPGIFTAVMDYMEFADALVADTGHSTA